MLTIEVEFLADRYTATRFDDRNSPEWPPHPARLFSALVAVWADADHPDLAERAALEWLELLGAPEISCSSAGERAVVTHYVPVNDASIVGDLSNLYRKVGKIEADIAAIGASGYADPRLRQRLVLDLDRARGRVVDDSRTRAAVKTSDSDAVARAAEAMMPQTRGRQARTYPTSLPDDPRVQFVWRDATPPAAHRASLDDLLARLWRLGHSSSHVSGRVLDEARPSAYVPVSEGGSPFRVPARGMFERLVLDFARHQGSEPRTMPAVMARYDTPADTASVAQPLLAGEWFVLARCGGTALPVVASLAFARAIRAALQSHADDPVDEMLSGHIPGPPGIKTPPSKRPHVAIVPLPFVGHPHADGSLLGAALVLPKDVAAQERRAVLRSLGGWRGADRSFTVLMGRVGAVQLELADKLDTRETLQRRTWCRPSADWASVTPVALDRFPGALWRRGRDADPGAMERASGIVERSCELVGLPVPDAVSISSAPFVTGVPPLRAFPPYRVPSGPLSRVLVHVRLHFSERVAGPVLIGAGRYLGYGLCRPVDASGARNDR